jgi:hypothetical protein
MLVSRISDADGSSGLPDPAYGVFENVLTGLVSMKSQVTTHEQRQLRVARSRRIVASLAPALFRYDTKYIVTAGLGR